MVVESLKSAQVGWNPAIVVATVDSKHRFHAHPTVWRSRAPRVRGHHRPRGRIYSHQDGKDNMDGCYPWMNRSSIGRTWSLGMALNLLAFILVSEGFNEPRPWQEKHTPRCEGAAKTVHSAGNNYLSPCWAHEGDWWPRELLSSLANVHVRGNKEFIQ